MRRNISVYAVILVLFGVASYWIIYIGSRINPRVLSSHLRVQPEQTDFAFKDMGVLILQFIIILAVAKLVGKLFQKMRQPAVIGEMVGGILLGPSFLGWILPQVQVLVFVPASLGPLQLLSQIGVILFLFSVGMSLDLRHLRKRADAAVLISHVSILIPFLLGLALSLFVFRSLAPSGISFTVFSLFMAIAMSITAFPVLARIIKERELTGTYLGTIAIACAAVDDATAWCILAVVVAVARTGGVADSLLTVALTVIFATAMMFVIRPGVAKFLQASEDETYNKKLLGGILLFVFACAFVTELIGIHALFGAFLAGVVIPGRKNLRSFLERSSVFLLPLFFAFSGLRTRLDLLNDWKSWMTCLAIILIAIVGKLCGSTLAARWTGMSWRESFSLGALMNTRGLIELIVLNIGYDMGILSREIFSMMILMALVTTFMTSPLLSLFRAKSS